MGFTEKDKKEIYDNLRKNFITADIKEEYPNISERDLEMCMGTNIYEYCETMRLEIGDALFGFKDMTDIGKIFLKTIKTQILDQFGYYDRRKGQYNKFFLENKKEFEQDCNDYTNPFFLDRKKFERQFVDFSEDTEQQIIAKTIFWSNNVTKPLELMKEKVIEDVSSKNNGIDLTKVMHMLDKECKNIFSGDGEILRDDFIRLYQSYLLDDITKEELENDSVYTLVQSVIDVKAENYDISLEDMYRFFCLNTSIDTLYRVKDAFSEKIISEYSKSQKTGNDTIRIFKRENDDLDCTLKGKNKKSDVTIVVKGTNIPFRVHIPEILINDAEYMYDVKIPEGGFDDPRSTIAVITYNEDEKEKIDILYERAYFSLPVFDYVKQQWNMQNDINMVPMKEVKNVESKLEENSKEKKDSNSIEI